MKNCINFLSFFCIASLFNLSCNKEYQIQKYSIDLSFSDSSNIQLNKWNVLGPITLSEYDSLMNLIDIDYLAAIDIPEDSFVVNPMNSARIISLKGTNTLFCGSYCSEEELIDFRDIYGINQKDTLPINKSATYLFCTIHSDKETDCYLLLNTSLEFKIWLDTTELPRPNISGLNRFPVHFKKGDNTLIIKAISTSDNLTIEGRLCGKETILDEYCKQQMGNLIYPMLFRNDNMLYLTNGHQDVIDSTYNTYMEMYDVTGNQVFSQKLSKDTSAYFAPGLEYNKSYLCIVHIENRKITQPVLNGNPDEVYNKYVSQKSAMDKNDPLAIQLTEILYRMNFLLNHESRNNDWWWGFKISHLTYEIDNILNNKDNKNAIENHSFGIQFKTYISELDSSAQRYLLITPDNFTHTKNLPLVVVVRPHVDNHYHFFTSPQIARYWSLTQAKTLANTYGYVVMMPEARLYVNEDLIPFAESEILYAIEDVKKQYNIDPNRIYLQGNCTGGYRALKMAAKHPDLFAAVGMYAPSYHPSVRNEWAKTNSPENLLNNLKNTPLFIHYDPYDTHSPYFLYKDLISDCKKKKINLTLSSQKHSGMFYNIILVGEETFSFFKDKKKKANINPPKETTNTITENNIKPVIADLYAQPFIFIYDSSNKSEEYIAIVDSIKSEYENYLFSTLPLVGSNEITEKQMSEKNLFFIGHLFENEIINRTIAKLPLNLNYDPKLHKGITIQEIYANPYNNGKKQIVVYTSNTLDSFYHIINYPWISGLSKRIEKYK